MLGHTVSPQKSQTAAVPLPARFGNLCWCACCVRLINQVRDVYKHCSLLGQAKRATLPILFCDESRECAFCWSLGLSLFGCTCPSLVREAFSSDWSLPTLAFPIQIKTFASRWVLLLLSFQSFSSRRGLRSLRTAPGWIGRQRYALVSSFSVPGIEHSF